MKIRIAVLAMLICLATFQTTNAHARARGAAAQTGNAVLTVSNGLASQPGNPLSGASLALLRESFESILRKTRLFDGQPSAVRAWTSACATRSPACRKALGNLEAAVVAQGQMEPGGRMTFPAVPPGTYYLSAQTFSVQNAQPAALIWDLRVDLKPGANAVTLDRSNTALHEAISELARPAAARAQPVADAQPCQGGDAPTAARSGARADSALSVVGTGYVYTYTQTNRFGQVVNSFTERGNFANTTLYLLDEDADSILQQASVQPGLLGSRLATFTLIDAGSQVANVPGMSAITSLLGQGSREEVAEFTRQRQAEFECVMKAIRAHSVAEMTTSAAARGIFPRVPAGTYYLFGRFYRITKPARGGGVLWNLPVTLKPGQNVLRLSVDNAALK